jgi:hypothetical protein
VELLVANQLYKLLIHFPWKKILQSGVMHNLSLQY